MARGSGQSNQGGQRGAGAARGGLGPGGRFVLGFVKPVPPPEIVTPAAGLRWGLQWPHCRNYGAAAVALVGPADKWWTATGAGPMLGNCPSTAFGGHTWGVWGGDVSPSPAITDRGPSRSDGAV